MVNKKRPSEPAMVSIPGACKRLGVGVSTLRRWIEAGLIPAYRLGIKTVRLRIADIEVFIESATIHPAIHPAKLEHDRDITGSDR